ncbi:MAG TPA: GNAT family N-acetyltransferase, partial [Nitrososphaerales archaeon]|nr:GNAT family N-acetyltransferase [Nitrososphaerales archaeon]
EDTKVFRALAHGLRNKPPVNLKSLDEVIVTFAGMISDFPEIAEMDINPLFMAGSKVVAADVRIVLDPASIDYVKPYPHLVIMPYPTKYVVPWKLRDGTDVLLRPIRPEDEAIESEFIDGLSEETSRYRFFSIVRNLPHSDLVRFCNIDYDREIGIVAIVTEGGRQREIGVGRIISEPDRRRGEFAVVISDQYQGKGLGRKLVDMVIDIAQEKRLESIYGLVLRDNQNMLGLCREMGFTLRPEEDVVRVELQLEYPQAASQGLPASTIPSPGDHENAQAVGQ